MILLSAENLGRKLNHTDSLCRKLFTEHNSLGRKQEIAEVSAEAKYDGQSLQEAKISGLVYTLCSFKIAIRKFRKFFLFVKMAKKGVNKNKYQ